MRMILRKTPLKVYSNLKQMTPQRRKLEHLRYTLPLNYSIVQFSAFLHESLKNEILQ